MKVVKNYIKRKQLEFISALIIITGLIPTIADMPLAAEILLFVIFTGLCVWCCIATVNGVASHKYPKTYAYILICITIFWTTGMHYFLDN